MFFSEAREIRKQVRVWRQRWKGKKSKRRKRYIEREGNGLDLRNKWIWICCERKITKPKPPNEGMNLE